jgi:hypothetical protein
MGREAEYEAAERAADPEGYRDGSDDARAAQQWAQQCGQYRLQRDELLLALRKVRDYLTAPFVDSDGMVRHYLKAIIAIQDAIDKVESGG